jgi:uncharacterized protein (DUF58 family)
MLAAAAAYDLVSALRAASKVKLRLDLPKHFATGRARLCSLDANNPLKRAVMLECRLAAAWGWRASGLEGSLRVPARGRYHGSARVSPGRRGVLARAELFYRAHGRLGLWSAQGIEEVARGVKVLPDLAPAARALKLWRAAAGVGPVSGIGTGTEIEGLREYRPGDSSRDIDWKVTSRVGTTVVRTYKPESSVDLLMLLDTGALMGSRDAGESVLERAIAGCLALGAAALAGGDTISVASFSDKVDSCANAGRGLKAMPRLLGYLAGVEASMRASDYGAAIEYALSRLKKRSIIAMVSGFWDESPFDALRKPLASARKRHEGFMALVKPKALLEALDGDAPEPRAAAQELLIARREGIESLKRMGWPVIDTAPDRLAGDLVLAYRSLKAGSALRL